MSDRPTPAGESEDIDELIYEWADGLTDGASLDSDPYSTDAAVIGARTAELDRRLDDGRQAE